MAKIGTAHIEVKPVLNESALDEIAARIEAAVRTGIEAGLTAARPIVVNQTFAANSTRTPEDAAVLANVIRERTARYEQGNPQD